MPPVIRALLTILLISAAQAGPKVINLHPGNTPVIQTEINRLTPGSPYTILRLAPGSYREKINVPKGKPPFKILGAPNRESRIVWGDTAETLDSKGKALGTFRSSSVTIESDDFAAENVIFENDHGPGVQAVALSIGGDRGVFRNCRFLGWQDTLLLRKKRHFFDQCHVVGSVDFIFGDATAFFDQCRIEVLDKGYITAASTARESKFGFVFSECKLSAPGGQPFFLGRPWGPHASVHFLNCEMPAEVQPGGWDNWRDPKNEESARYGEWRSSGPGARPADRVRWSHQLDDPTGRGLSRPWTVLSKWDPDFLLSPERISRLPQNEQDVWFEYLERSQEALKHCREAFREEMEGAGIEHPLKPADHGEPPSDDRDPKWYESDEATRLAKAVISFQTPTGAWSKSINYGKGPRQAGMHWSSQGGGEFPWHYVGTIDNKATTGEIRFLTRYYEATRNSAARTAILRGLDHLSASRYPNGGWPQVWPLEGGYHDHITLNDDAMIHVLELLADVAEGKEPFGFVDRKSRKRAEDDLRAGINCLIAAQIRLNGKPSVWCAQHDPLTLHAAGARLQEPASLSSAESVSVLRFLIRHAPDRKEAIQGGIDWFERSKLTGIRREKRDGRNYYAENTGDSELWWGRFHDLETNRPIFSGADDGHIYLGFADLFAGNPTEYQYYTTQARSLLEKDYPRWKANH